MAIQDTQSEPWRRGFEWAADLDSTDTCEQRTEKLGYDFISDEWHEFMRGAEFKQNEQQRELAEAHEPSDTYRCGPDCPGMYCPECGLG